MPAEVSCTSSAPDTLFLHCKPQWAQLLNQLDSLSRSKFIHPQQSENSCLGEFSNTWFPFVKVNLFPLQLGVVLILVMMVVFLFLRVGLNPTPSMSASLRTSWCCRITRRSDENRGATWSWTKLKTSRTSSPNAGKASWISTGQSRLLEFTGDQSLHRLFGVLVACHLTDIF